MSSFLHWSRSSTKPRRLPDRQRIDPATSSSVGPVVPKRKRPASPHNKIRLRNTAASRRSRRPPFRIRRIVADAGTQLHHSGDGFGQRRAMFTDMAALAAIVSAAVLLVAMLATGLVL